MNESIDVDFFALVHIFNFVIQIPELYIYFELWYSRETNLICSIRKVYYVRLYIMKEEIMLWNMNYSQWVVGGLGWFFCMEMIALLESCKRRQLNHDIQTKLSYTFPFCCFSFRQCIHTRDTHFCFILILRFSRWNFIG